MKRILRLFPLFLILMVIVGCAISSNETPESKPTVIVIITEGQEEVSEPEQVVEEESISEQQRLATENLMPQYDNYVAAQKEKAKPVRGEGVEPAFFGYHLIAYHKEDGDSRYVLKPFTVTTDGRIFLSETQVQGVELQPGEVQDLVANEYLSQGLDLLVPDGNGGEEKAMMILKEFIDGAIGENDFKIGLIGYMFIFGELGSEECLMLSVGPAGEGFVAYQK